MKNRLQYPSLRFLQKRISDLFTNKGLHPAFPGSGCDLVWPSEEIIDVVLFGDALRVLLDADRWPRFRRYRLWVLNEEHRSFLVKAFAIPESHLGVIPRPLLVASSSKDARFPSLEKSLNFIFSGRPVAGKNLTLISDVVRNFQERGIQAQLCIYGYSEPENFRRYFRPEAFIVPPQIHGDKGEHWFKHVPENSVYLNLGSELTDDFCVSCAEAEESGWPMILPARGPYKEVTSRGRILVPMELIRSRDAFSIADHILEHWGGSTEKRPKTLTDLKVPNFLEYKSVTALVGKKSKFVHLIRKTFSEGVPSPSHDKLLSLLEKK